MINNNPSLWLADYHHIEDIIGKLLIYASYNNTGAPINACMIARRVGAGQTTIACPRDRSEFFATMQLGAFIEEYVDTASFATLIDEYDVHAVLMGRGCGVNVAVRERVMNALKKNIAIILDSQSVLSFGQSLQILQPASNEAPLVICITPAEIGLIQNDLVDIPPAESCKILAQRIKGIVVVRTKNIIISDGIDVFCNNDLFYSDISGNNDIIEGIIAGLLSTKMRALPAVLMAVYIHGIAEKKLGKGLICEDFGIIIPSIITEITTQ